MIVLHEKKNQLSLICLSKFYADEIKLEEDNVIENCLKLDVNTEY